MKRFITIMLVLTLAFSALTVSTFAASSSKGKTVKVKKATYQKYKKAYKENQDLKLIIAQQQATIDSMKASSDSLQKTIADKDSLNMWVWSCIKSLGLKYKDKTWTIPASYSDKFIINGTTYYVVKEK